MKRGKQIEALFQRIDREFDDIAAEYEYCRQKKKMSDSLKINILDFFNHNKIILDYLAQEIIDCCPQRPKKVYFPIAKKSVNKVQFETNLKKWFPHLKTLNPDLYNYLIEIQYWNGNEFLPEFNDVLISYKHIEDVPQKIAKFHSCIISFKDKALRVGEKGIKTLTISEGGVLELKASDGDVAVIRGPQKIDDRTRKLKNADPRIKIKKEKWKDFKFDVSEHTVIGLLEITRLNAKRIYTRIKKILQSASSR